MSFITLDCIPTYEIQTVFPFMIRSADTHELVVQTINNDGYIEVILDGTTYLLHYIIALQFIPAIDHSTEVKHMNANKLDNRIENLSWISTTRVFNKQITEYVLDFDTLNTYKLTEYEGAKLNRYYYDIDNNKLLMFTHNKYKIVKPTLTKSNRRIVSLATTDGYHKNVNYNLLIKHLQRLSSN